MVKPLTFKGDKPKKRKTRTENTEAPTSKSRKTATTPDPEEPSPDDQSWVSADAPSDISGPVVIVLPSDDPSCIASDPNGQVFASKLENLVDNDPATAEPHDVRQVWVASRVAGTESFSFKGHHGKYLSSDSHGILSATASAVSHYESFLIIPSPEVSGTFSLQTHGGDGELFVCVKENSKATAGVEIRGDANMISFETTVRVRMQARFKPKLRATRESKAYEKISKKELEGIVGRRLSDDEVKKLRKGRKEGNFHEILLDVKVSGKHDKWA
ncbi:Actin cross-linking [Penicillium sp. DV-2018c]|nr:Actin cross-linking [Penicillium sp. DV-2018c]KAJ5543401.1 Actin cross-linking [Penicillium sp. DV-2018c]KAJ5572158.1 Actin cross-linking [Penicillium sp. DV-2018c]KAJ5572169.1 Actin cross-linking [Penicillium sp. DV-2018c]